MRSSPSRQAGFTLIEIAVVVVILATMSGMSVLAINQAFDRRYQSQAENLLTWLNQLSEQAALEGVAYGIVGDAEDPQESQKLQPVAYFRQHWFITSYPEAFVLDNQAKAEWTVYRSAEYDAIEDPLAAEEDALIPLIAMLPDGYMEPAGELLLSFSSSPLTYSYSWDDESSSMIMQKKSVP
jgi:prepilin-type N-terminal cleavage/methylation domain-containing protein|tara:strand:+ start:413 stop:958 length:546 start_codon:yes stop_codon:yes gene_type:complete